MSSRITNKYRLVNPYTEGSFKPVTDARNPFSAAKKLYNGMAKYFTNSVDHMGMTVQNLETKEMSHFRINENRKDNMVDYDISRIDGNYSQIDSELLDRIKKLEKQSGGRKHHHHRRRDDSTTEDSSSSSSSSSEDEFYRRTAYLQPITRFVYFPLPQYKLVGLSPFDINRIFAPIFSWPLTPSVEFRLDLQLYNI